MSSIIRYATTRDPATASETMRQMTAYVNDVSSMVGDEKQMIYSMSATEYWNIFGKQKYPQLYMCAKEMNGMVCSSASAERVWSIFAFVHKPLRNRLANEKVEKLVFLYVNSGILDEKDKNNYISVEGFGLSENDFL